MNYQFAQDIKVVIELLGLSHSDFARELKISRSTLNNWLTENHEPDDRNVKAFYEFTYSKGVQLNRIKEQLYTEETSASNGLLLFHGSKAEIEGIPDLKHAKNQNDFGPGFYCGDTMEQAITFVAAYPNASLYMVKFNPEGLQRCEFHVNQDWMLTVAYYRNLLESYNDSKIVHKLAERVEKSDYVIAPIADNRMFEIIDQFIDGELTDVQCQHCLSATNLGTQYVFRTQEAMRQVQLLEHCFLSDTEKYRYMQLKQDNYAVNRDKVKVARKQYRNQGKYIEEILQ